MSTDLRDVFDQAGRNPPTPGLDVDVVLYRAWRSRRRRITGVVVATVAITLALGVGLASERHRSAAPDPAAPFPKAPALGSLGRLAFGLDGDVYLADADGKNRVRIADGSPGMEDDCANYWAEGPVWSPDGQYFVYRGDGNAGGTTAAGCPSSHLVNISDPSGVRIASFPGEGWRIAWSPDSSRLAAWVDFASTLGIYGLDGKRQALLKVTVGGMTSGDVDPVWSPDGTSLLLPGGVEIPLDGSTPRQLSSDDPRSQWWFAYSPDGANIATISEAGLTVAAADGSHARVLVASGGGHSVSWVFGGPVWSPTGDRIAFVSQQNGGSGGKNSKYELAVLDVARGTVVSLADIASHADAAKSVIEFSAKGDQILFTRMDAAGARSLWSVHTDGSDPHRLVAEADWGDWQTLAPMR